MNKHVAATTVLSELVEYVGAVMPPEKTLLILGKLLLAWLWCLENCDGKWWQRQATRPQDDALFEIMKKVTNDEP